MILLGLMLASPVTAQVRVNPTGVNVNTQGATTVFLTYGGLSSQVPVEAFWCGELIPAAPALGLKCDPATIFGQLPIRYDQTRLSATGALTDVMSIPASVARRGYQEAERGRTSSFFYVRRFVSSIGAPDEYVAVTCRLAGGGARVPFALTDVNIAFNGEAPVLFVQPGGTVLPFSAEITYTGTGRLRGRWEVVLPGEELPTSIDLLTEATLPPEERGTQRRYTELERFNVFLPPRGRVILPGPDPRRVPTSAVGAYLVLLRVEVSDDKEGDSDLGAVGAGTGILHSGAVAGFPLPPLRYVVGAAGEDVTLRQSGRALQLLLPREAAVVPVDSALIVSWLPEAQAGFYRVEFESDEGTPLFSAIVQAGAGAYRPPPFVLQRVDGKPFRWRVLALDVTGREMRRSAWRNASGRSLPPSVDPPD